MVSASNSRAAASALTVSRDRQTLVLACAVEADAPDAACRRGLDGMKTIEQVGEGFDFLRRRAVAGLLGAPAAPGARTRWRPRSESASAAAGDRRGQLPSRANRPSASRVATSSSASRVILWPSGAITCFHQSVSGMAPRSSSQNDSVARTTDSLNSTRGEPRPGCSAVQALPSADRSCASRARSAFDAAAAFDSV